MSAQLVFKNLTDPIRITQVRIFEGLQEPSIYDVAGWSSANGGGPVGAYAVQVEDSGSGAGFLVYGGDWGLRLRPAGSGDGWSLEDAQQFGETHLVLADREDLIE